MEEKFKIKIKDEFPDSHYFVYKNKQYPIKFKYFKLSSKYFQRNRDEYKRNKKIKLIDNEEGFENDEINIPDTIIEEFIQYVQHQPIFLNKENVLFLQYLSKRFEINELTNITNKYIDSHHKELVIEILQNLLIFNDKGREEYEKIISNNLSEFISNEELVKVNVSTIHRILHQYKSNKNKDNSITKLDQQINEFIFKLIDKHGRSASILLTFLEKDEFSKDHLSILMNKYYEIIDFDFIDKNIFKIIYELLNDQIKINQQQNQMISNLQTKIETERTKQKSEIKKIEKEKETEIRKLTESSEKLRDEYSQKLNDEKKLVENLNSKILFQEEEFKTKIQEKQLENEKEKQKHENELKRMNQFHEEQIKKIKNEYEEIEWLQYY